MTTFVLRRKLFTTDIEGAQNEINNLENILKRTDPNSARYKTLQENLNARRASLNSMKQTSSLVPSPTPGSANLGGQTSKNLPATVTTPKLHITTPKPPAKFNWGKAGKAAFIVGGTYLIGKALFGGKKKVKEKTYSIKRIVK